MERPNPFYRRSRISVKKFRQLLRLFALDLTATDAAQLTGLTRKTVTTIFIKIRERIAEECERELPLSSGEVEVDESYFGAHRVRGNRGRGAGGKTIVFGLLKREGRVYTEIVAGCKKVILQAIIRGRVSADAVIHLDGWRGYDGLVDVGYAKHFRVNHGQSEFMRGTQHINGIESFWSYAKHRLQQLHGIAPEKFYWHLKECQYRFNLRKNNVYAELLKLLRKYPL